MDRRHYLTALAAIVGAGCMSNETTPSVTYESPTDSPPGEFTSLTDPGLWEYDIPDRSARIAVGDELYIGTNTTLAAISTSGDTTWTVDSPSYAVADVYEITVAGSTVYYVARDSRRGEVGAHGISSGEQRWTTTPGQVPNRVIDVTEDAVFASATDDDSVEGPVFAFDAETGEKQWKTSAVGLGSAVSHGLCLVYSHRNGLIALDTATGEVQWERTPGDKDTERYEVIDDTLCLFTDDGTVHGYALPDGTHRWEQSLPDDLIFVQRPPPGSAQAADLYITDSQANLTALNATTGEKRWVVETHGGYVGFEQGMCLGTDSLFHRSGTALASYDLVDGTREWAYSLESEYEYNVPGPSVTDGTVFVITRETNEKPSIKTFDAETGSRDWRVQLAMGDSRLPWVVGVFDEYAVLRTNTGLVGLPLTFSSS